MKKTNYNDPDILIIHADDINYPWETEEFGESLRKASESVKRGEFYTLREADNESRERLKKRFGIE
jgi:hypothetical protein